MREVSEEGCEDEGVHALVSDRVCEDEVRTLTSGEHTTRP